MPDAISTQARKAVATALDTALSATVYPVAPRVPIPPCVTLVPDTPWMIPATFGGRLRVQLNLRALVVTLDNNDLGTHETLLENVLVALPEGTVVKSVSPPSSSDLGAQGSVLVSEVNFSLNLKE
jgi:hypothetical protein